MQKIEDIVFKSGCVRIMACIPSPRRHLQRWIERRQYVRVGSTVYPAAGVGHVLKSTSEDNPASMVELVRYMKTKPSSATADTKGPKILSLVKDSEINATTGAGAGRGESGSTVGETTVQGFVPREALTRGGGGLMVSDEMFADHGRDYDVDSASGGKESVGAGYSSAPPPPVGASDRHHLPPMWRANPPIPEAAGEDLPEEAS